LGLGIGSGPKPKHKSKPKPKTQRDPDPEFNSLLFGIGIKKKIFGSKKSKKNRKKIFNEFQNFCFFSLLVGSYLLI